jgi:hypothetical protein
MATPRDPAPAGGFEAPPDDDQPVVPEPARGAPSADPEAPEADAVEQAAEVSPGGARTGPVTNDPEAPEADAWEQSQEVPYDDEEPV